ncbi:MAG: aminotransferase class I/II-fold pyridoxal phosphate-dependent enzyme [Bacteroidetes bacterium]|nr:aminotransferase class I/II-fold pyridoxal phosphate-dependent enzyme [Bacteroidota bacterium]MBL6962326.1 aminotransferase class I/II-fold pyridoxal phosphate-dependent enzyme [Bacteroidota bacterium]
MARTKHENPHVNLNLNVRGLKTSATLEINERSQKLIQEGKEVFKFGLGQSPFPVPDQLVQSLQENAHQKDYLPVKGLELLREAVADFNYRTQKIHTSADDVMIGPGSKELIFILQLVYYGDLLIPLPSWVSYAPQAKIIGRNVTWVPTREDNFWRISPEELEAICIEDPDRPRILILNYPSNPTGYTYPIERLKLLAQVARKYHVILISDEIYGMIHHHGQHVSIARYYPEGTIISSGLSKWCGAGGWRLGTFSFPPNLTWLLKSMCVVASETYTSTSAPIQYAAVTAFNGSPEIDSYLTHSRSVLKSLGKYLTHEMNRLNIHLPAPHGGFYIFPNFEAYREKLMAKGIASSADLCNTLLENTGVAMLPGSDFGINSEKLVSRLAYVDFDGRKALIQAGLHPIENSFQEVFIKEHCPKIVQGMERIGNWLKAL